jgi:hypothetical protein
MWFEELPDRSLPVSMSSKTADEWIAKKNEPADWALGFPAVDVAEYLWATADGRRVLGESPSARRPAGAPSLEDFVNTAVKVRRAAAGRDSIGTRIYARETALLAPAILRKLNPERVVRTGREAITAARDLPVAPEHYIEDFSVAACLEPCSEEAVAKAVDRLALELLAFIRDRDPHVDPQPDVATYVLDGTLERYLRDRA